MGFDWENEVVLITGASAGLGRALALRATELHATVILIARNEERLRDVGIEISAKGGTPFIFPFDLQEVNKIPALYKCIVQEVKKKSTILINNVGYQVAGFVQNTPLELYEKNYRVNVLAPIALIQSVLPDMIMQKKGVIVNIMSAIMYHSFPGVSSYCASKSALGAIHESLKIELAGLPIRILSVNPGGFRSDYWRNTDVGNRIRDFKYPSEEKLTDPSCIANKIYKAIEKGKENLNLGSFKDKIGYQLRYWTPQILEKVIIYNNRALLSKRPII